jgi:hypothetical protein
MLTVDRTTLPPRFAPLVTALAVFMWDDFRAMMNANADLPEMHDLPAWDDLADDDVNKRRWITQAETFVTFLLPRIAEDIAAWPDLNADVSEIGTTLAGKFQRDGMMDGVRLYVERIRAQIVAPMRAAERDV